VIGQDDKPTVIVDGLYGPSVVKSDAERAKLYRDRKRGSMPRKLQPCGTRAAATRHRRNGEPVCGACEDAERKYWRDQPRNQPKPDESETT
jgi:hypothetical protein